jgi:hypothetical protein
LALANARGKWMLLARKSHRLGATEGFIKSSLKLSVIKEKYQAFFGEKRVENLNGKSNRTPSKDFLNAHQP